ncbi:MAG: sigma-70 family RNA polymerase sigma factor [Lentisphaerae bacterium]|nr:sigma-70 family RNA polymerase sigma factor [Lentisphaerota bacterium]
MQTATADGGRGGSSRTDDMETIVSEHETALLRYAARLLNNASDAQDVVQNVFIKLFQQWREGARPTAQLKSWLFRVTHNEAVDYIRRESRLKILHEKQLNDPTAECPDGRNCAMSVEEKRQLILAHLRRLSDSEQQVVLLRLDAGLSYREIGGITGRSEGNVGNILHHAVKKLAAAVRQEAIHEM